MQLLSRISLLVLLAASPLFAQQKPVPKHLPGTLQIFGPVHTIRQERAEFTNKDGELVEGPRVLMTTLTCNEDGTQQERTTYVQGQIIRRVVETYNLDGRLQESNVFNRDGVLDSRTVSVYGEDKRLSERVTYRKDGTLASRTVFRHQGNQSQNETIAYDANGNVAFQSATTNDLKNKTAESRLYTPRESKSMQVAMADNPDGSREFKEEGTDGSFKREVFKPEGKTQSSKIIYNRDGTIQRTERFVHEYDSYGNIIKTTRLIAAGDSNDFRPDSVNYRIITYYEKN